MKLYDGMTYPDAESWRLRLYKHMNDELETYDRLGEGGVKIEGLSDSNVDTTTLIEKDDNDE